MGRLRKAFVKRRKFPDCAFGQAAREWTLRPADGQGRQRRPQMVTLFQGRIRPRDWNESLGRDRAGLKGGGSAVVGRVTHGGNDRFRGPVPVSAADALVLVMLWLGHYNRCGRAARLVAAVGRGSPRVARMLHPRTGHHANNKGGNKQQRQTQHHGHYPCRAGQVRRWLWLQ